MCVCVSNFPLDGGNCVRNTLPGLAPVSLGVSTLNSQSTFSNPLCPRLKGRDDIRVHTSVSAGAPQWKLPLSVTNTSNQAHGHTTKTSNAPLCATKSLFFSDSSRRVHNSQLESIDDLHGHWEPVTLNSKEGSVQNCVLGSY